jgi:membrane associated rhomboid family serine protease
VNHWSLIKSLAGVLVLGGAFGCSIHLYRFASATSSPRPPIAAICLIGTTALITALQFIFPEILSEFRRNPAALRAGEWWRVVTPLFVQAEGWIQAGINGVGALIFLPLGEKLYGKRFLVLYFVSGLVGEIAGYFWNPDGAGSSVGIAGVIGALFVFAYVHQKEVRGPMRVLALAGLCGAALLIFSPDLHGPPILAGALLGSLMLPKSSPARN